jgi:hypothetical protein
MHHSDNFITAGTDISGVPGTGKTATVLEVIRHLQHKSENEVCIQYSVVLNDFIVTIVHGPLSEFRQISVCRDQRHEGDGTKSGLQYLMGVRQARRSQLKKETSNSESCTRSPGK